MPTEPDASSNRGGARPNSGPEKGAVYATTNERNGLVRRVANLEAQFSDDRKDTTGKVAPKALSVMRRRLNFHLARVADLQDVLSQPGASAMPSYRDDLAELERHLREADASAERIAPYESARLATIKKIGRDDQFDQDLSELPDDGLVELARKLGAVVPPAANDDPGPVKGPGTPDNGGPAPATDAGVGRTAAAG
jgi:hypothetical protein